MVARRGFLRENGLISVNSGTRGFLRAIFMANERVASVVFLLYLLQISLQIEIYRTVFLSKYVAYISFQPHKNWNFFFQIFILAIFISLYILGS